MAWYDSVVDAFSDDDEKDTKGKDKTKTKGKDEKSWYDDFGWDDVGETLSGLGGLFDSDEDDKTSNPGRTQQPAQTVKDNNGNAVTGSKMAASAKDNTLLYVGGGVAVLVLLGVVVLVATK